MKPPIQPFRKFDRPPSRSLARVRRDEARQQLDRQPPTYGITEADLPY